MSGLNKLISEDNVGMVQAFIDGRCEVKLAEYDIREALEMFLSKLTEEVKARYGIVDPVVEYVPDHITAQPVDKRMAQDGGPFVGDHFEALARAYDTGLQVGVTLTNADIFGELHGEFCHLSRMQWLAMRRGMALSEAVEATLRAKR